MGKTVVQVNGKLYDAVSGRRIIDIASPPEKPVVQRVKKPSPIAVTTVSKQARQPAAHAKHRHPESSKTLVRRAVKKPSAGLKKQMHVQHEISHSEQQSIVVKHIASHVDTARLHRATATEKNQQVHRFHSPAVVPTTFTHVQVQTPPQDLPANEPLIVPPPTPSNDPPDIFEQAIANASHFVDITAHKTHLKKKARQHALTMVAGVTVLLFLGGFLALRNTPSLQVKMAGVVAGVSTHMPNFAAAGFTYEGVSGKDSRLVYTFRSDLARYQMVEQTTNWSGEEMIRQVSSVAANGAPNYTTVQAEGRTIYKFSDRHATWITHGTWYQVHGEQPFSDAQLAALAKNS
ncbi:hypothetical protein IPL85_03850 [Candidatus Saccharibacteria bacterium]|nr:MAG: hypothetical protein IPL85_03850 [Candidatus Saccharibacteria bacterium]